MAWAAGCGGLQSHFYRLILTCILILILILILTPSHPQPGQPFLNPGNLTDEICQILGGSQAIGFGGHWTAARHGNLTDQICQILECPEGPHVFSIYCPWGQ